MKKIKMAAAAAFLSLATQAQAAVQGVMYKNPGCECCEGHVEHLRKNGINVHVIEHKALDSFRKSRGIPDLLVGCHTILINGYLVEGHVPAAAIKKLLAERPKIKGISVPGMPANSPGMEKGVMKPSTLKVYAMSAGAPKVFMNVKVAGGTFPAHAH